VPQHGGDGDAPVGPKKQGETGLHANHEERPHPGMDNDVLVAGAKASTVTNGKDEKPPPDVVPVLQIACRERLGGVLKHYYRVAA
jgi:putative transposase